MEELLAGRDVELLDRVQGSVLGAVTDVLRGVDGPGGHLRPVEHGQRSSAVFKMVQAEMASSSSSRRCHRPAFDVRSAGYWCPFQGTDQLLKQQ